MACRALHLLLPPLSRGPSARRPLLRRMTRSPRRRSPESRSPTSRLISPASRSRTRTDMLVRRLCPVARARLAATTTTTAMSKKTTTWRLKMARRTSSGVPRPPLRAIRPRQARDRSGRPVRQGSISVCLTTNVNARPPLACSHLPAPRSLCIARHRLPPATHHHHRPLSPTSRLRAPSQPCQQQRPSGRASRRSRTSSTRRRSSRPSTEPTAQDASRSSPEARRANSFACITITTTATLTATSLAWLRHRSDHLHLSRPRLSAPRRDRARTRSLINKSKALLARGCTRPRSRRSSSSLTPTSPSTLHSATRHRRPLLTPERPGSRRPRRQLQHRATAR